jgi:Flp pilus assembly protein TadG
MIKRFFNRWRRDRRGVSAVEFAFIAPVLILCYFGVAELCGAMMAQRRSVHVASEVGDLVAQYSSVQSSNFTDLWTIGSTVMSPLSSSGLSIRVTSFVTDSSNHATVGWSMDNGGSLTKYAKGSSPTTAQAQVMAGLTSASSSIIYSETRYTYTSPVSVVVKVPLTFNGLYWLSPRQVTSIPCSDC